MIKHVITESGFKQHKPTKLNQYEIDCITQTGYKQDKEILPNITFNMTSDFKIDLDRFGHDLDMFGHVWT